MLAPGRALITHEETGHLEVRRFFLAWRLDLPIQRDIQTKKSRSCERLFCTLNWRSVRSSRSNFGSSSSDLGSGSGSSVHGSGSSHDDFGSGSSNIGSGGSGGLFFFLTAGGQGHGSDQRSQQERLFHACVLKRSVKNGGLGTVFKARDPSVIEHSAGHKGRGCIATGVAPHSAIDYTAHRAVTYRPRVVLGIACVDRCEITSKSASQTCSAAGSELQTPRPDKPSSKRSPKRPGHNSIGRN